MSKVDGSGGSVPTPNERVGRALDDLTLAARPVVGGGLRRAYGDEWFRRAQQGPLARNPRAREDQLDAYALLALLSWGWKDCFAAILPAHARELVRQVSDARNDWGHQVQFSSVGADDTVRAIADLIAALPCQPYPAGGAGIDAPAPPLPPPFRLPGRRAAGSLIAAPAPRRVESPSNRRSQPRGRAIALLLLLVPGTLCGLGGVGMAVAETRRPVATRTTVTVVPSRSVPTPTAVKQTAPATAAVGRYVVVNTGGVGVYLRVSPGSAERLRAYPEGTPLQSIGTTTTSAGGSNWRQVRAPDGLVGWVAAEYLLPSP